MPADRGRRTAPARLPRGGARRNWSTGRAAARSSAPNVQVLCLSQLALLAIEEDDWTLAEMLASQARAQLDRSGDRRLPDDGPRDGGLRGGRGRAPAGSRRRPLTCVKASSCSSSSKTSRLGTRRRPGSLLARAAVRLGDTPAATRMLAEAARVLKLTPDAIVLGTWIADAEIAIETVSASGVHDLTPAELRVLQYLPTHLSFPRDRGPGVRLAKHGEDAGAGRLSQARGQLETGGGRTGACRRPAGGRRSLPRHRAALKSDEREPDDRHPQRSRSRSRP